MKRRYMQCDVFSGEALKGNGLPVVLDGEGLSAAQMQAFAAWTQQAGHSCIRETEWCWLVGRPAWLSRALSDCSEAAVGDTPPLRRRTRDGGVSPLPCKQKRLPQGTAY